MACRQATYSLETTPNLQVLTTHTHTSQQDWWPADRQHTAWKLHQTYRYWSHIHIPHSKTGGLQTGNIQPGNYTKPTGTNHTYTYLTVRLVACRQATYSLETTPNLQVLTTHTHIDIPHSKTGGLQTGNIQPGHYTKHTGTNHIYTHTYTHTHTSQQDWWPADRQHTA